MRPRKVIVLCDSQEQSLSIRRFLLETRGYRVVSKTSAAETLEYLRETSIDHIHLLMSDLILPQMDGNELARFAKRIHPMLPVLLVSTSVTEFDRAGAADAFLPKGACSAAEMLDKIRILVARKRGPRKVFVVVDEAKTA